MSKKRCVKRKEASGVRLDWIILNSRPRARQRAAHPALALPMTEDPTPPGALPHSLDMTILPGHWRVACAPGQTLLQAALAAGIELRSSCRNGTCRACIAQLRQGRVTYAIEWPGLSADEKDEGCVLPCVALAASDLVLLQPHAVQREAVSGTALPRSSPSVP